MKKLRKAQLKLDKEVISSLSEIDLSSVKGGIVNPPISDKCGYTQANNACITVFHGDCAYVSQKYTECNCKDTLKCVTPLTQFCEPLPVYSKPVRESCPCMIIKG